MIVYTKSKTMRKELEQRVDEGIIFTDDIKKAEIAISGRLADEDLHADLKAMVIPYVGYNQVNQSLLAKKGIKLYNTQVNGVFVAERALGLCLSLMGKIAYDFSQLKEGKWSTYQSPSEWISIRGKKVGLLGYGVIGKAIHDMLRPFACEVYTIDRKKDYRDALLVRDLEGLINEVDILFVQVPLTSETKHMIDASMLSKMEGMYVINVARGDIIEEKALYDALKKGVLKGFASDVWYQYPKKRTEERMPSAYPILDFDCVVATSHSSGNVEGIDALTYEDLAKRLNRFARGDYEGAIQERKEEEE